MLISKLIRIKEISQRTGEYHFVEYEIENEELIEKPADSILSVFDEKEAYATLKLKVNSKRIEVLNDSIVTINDFFNNLLESGDMYTGPEKTVLKIENLDFSKKFYNEDEQSLIRKAVTRIMMASNIVAKESRRGPCNTIILPRKLAVLLSDNFLHVIDKKEFQDEYTEIEEAFSFMHMTVFYSDNSLIENKVIVYRKPTNDDEPGVVLFRYQNDEKLVNIGNGNDWYKNVIVLDIK